MTTRVSPALATALFLALGVSTLLGATAAAQTAEPVMPPIRISPSTVPGEAPADDAPSEDTDEESSEEESDAGSDEEPTIDRIHIGFTPDQLFELGGGGHVVGEETLEEQEFDNPEAIVQQVPGVQVRGEDGFGLRPNIGLRGASSERSRKLTLMEDGVLFGPAPYAAPAAYYFPLMTRMVGVEVIKGPATVLYGPNTVGGALNLLTREVPLERSASLDLSGGSNLYRKLHGWYGGSNDWGGFLFEAAYVGSNGFKEIDGRPDDSTGFDRAEMMLRARLAPETFAFVQHALELKIGLSLEVSRETYTGLSDADFDDDPYRRYVATANDRMEWDRLQLQLRHVASIGTDMTLTTTAYRHDFSRSWRKLNGFADGPSLREILADPTGGQRQVFYEVLTGAQDSASRDERLVIGTNGRDYISEGAQLRYAFERAALRAEHELDAGVRLHHDYVDRDHTEDAFFLESGAFVDDDQAERQTADNRGEAVALAAHASYAVTAADLTINPGLRIEQVWTTFSDRIADRETSASHTAVLPGLGVHYAFTDDWGVLAGVHRGFSPVAPGQPDAVDPEFSISYEAGARYGRTDRRTYAEAVGFFNDFSNLTGECSFSVGCSDAQIGQQNNAGEVDVYGAEVAAHHAQALANGWELPIRLTYTFSESRFATSFTSDNPQFGEVAEGDELPYLPAHQGRVELGLDGGDWSVTAAATFVGEMREVAGGDDVAMTDRQALLDLFAAYDFGLGISAYARAENITSQKPVASRRPFGARPARPLRVMGGVKWDY